MQLETQRTRLRPFQEADLYDLHAYSSRPGVGELAGWKPHASLEESEQALCANIQNPNRLAIVWKDENRVIGHIAVHEDSEEGREDTRELGFALHPDYHRRGIMTEVVRRVLNSLFSDGIRHVYACCFQDNTASRRLIERCGFAFEREGAFYSPSLQKEFASYEYVKHAPSCENAGDEARSKSV